MSDNEWVKQLRHRWMFIKFDRPAGPFYSRCVKCGAWRITTLYRVPHDNRWPRWKSYTTYYGAGLGGPFKTNTALFTCEGAESLFPKWFRGVGPTAVQNELAQKGTVE